MKLFGLFKRRTWRPTQTLEFLPQDQAGFLTRIKGIPGLVPKVKARLGGRYQGLAKWITTIVLLLLIYYGVTTLVAWITAPRIEMTMSPVAGRIAVVAEPAKVEPILEKVTYTGSILPYQEVTVYPRVEGWVNEFKLYEGDRVQKGQVIARLDRAELNAMVERAKASVAQAERDLTMSRAALLEAEANLDFWEKEIKRFEILFQREAIAESDYDSAKKQYEAAKARVEGQKAAIHAKEADIERAKAEVERIKTVYGYTDIVAPITGHVAKRHIYAGILVKPGMPIVDLQDVSRVRVQVKVAEQDVPHIQAGHIGQGTETIVRFPALPNPHNEFKAQVSTVFPQLDPVTRTATVEMVLSNPNELIKTDMYAIVDLILEKKEQALTIPRSAVLEGPEKQPIVYVTDSVIAMSRPVKLGIAQGDRIEVLDGVKEGEMVVSKGQRSLSDGAQVNILAGL